MSPSPPSISASGSSYSLSSSSSARRSPTASTTYPSHQPRVVTIINELNERVRTLEATVASLQHLVHTLTHNIQTALPGSETKADPSSLSSTFPALGVVPSETQLNSTEATNGGTATAH
jgi:hypothetical protein